MTLNALPSATYIQTDQDLRQLIPLLEQENLLAIDTESNSMYAYEERVCLLQVSTRTADYIIDPLTINTMHLFGPLMANPRIEKIFHAAEYDVLTLKRDYQYEVTNVFDTMVAARICGFDPPGLNTLLMTFFNVELDKSHQRDDWGQRPLELESLRYAQMDTHYLPALRDILVEKLVEDGHLEEAREVSNEVCILLPTLPSFDPDGYWAIGRPHHLSRREMAVLRALYLMREQIARQRNKPPFRIMDNYAMVNIVRELPRTLTDLHMIRGVGKHLIRHSGRLILQAVADGLAAPPPNRPRPQQRASNGVMQRYAALREWRRDRADQRGITSEMIISKNQMWLLAEQDPKNLEEMGSIPGLGPWKLAQYGEELLEVLRRH